MIYVLLLALILIMSTTSYSNTYGSTPSNWTCKPFLYKLLIDSFYILLSTIFIDTLNLIMLSMDNTIKDTDDGLGDESFDN